MKNWFILHIIPLFLAFGCQNTKIQPFSGDIVVLKSGQNFGMCLGKCYNELIITENKVTFYQKVVSYPGIFEDYKHDESENLKNIQHIISGFDESKFIELNEVLGCPDCADGGSEWLEVIFKSGKSKRVTFEYGKPLPGFENMVKDLRLERQTYIEKYR